MNGVVPVPLREKVENHKSGIWKQHLELNAGEYIFVQAPSGTGKTTLVHTLYGLRTDYEGSVQWGDTRITQASAGFLSELRTTGVSVIFQDMRLFPGLTAWENLQVKRELAGTVSEEQVSAWMERLGMSAKKQSLGSTLSYGEQQRIAIIRALLQPFRWLLMDEPFSHLDRNNRDKARQLILEVVQANNAGLLLADLDENEYFPYTKKLWL